jgi:ribonuclease D
MKTITDSKALQTACETLAKGPFLTIDTEFLRETTYYPKLCLIQMSGPDKEVLLVDPLADALDLTPFWELMTDIPVLKIFHAARQDVEIIFHATGKVAAPIFDSQVAAAVCGYGESIGYDALVSKITGADIDKSSRFTDWSRRPLTDKQAHYAAADVLHLVDVYEALNAKLEKNSRSTWLDEEMAILTAVDTYRMDPENAWKRLKNRARKPRELLRLQQLAAWREEQAQGRDVPRGRILKDDALYELATQGPKDTDAMERLRAVPRGFGRSRDGKDIVSLMQSIEEVDKDDLPKLPRHSRNSPAPQAVVDLLRALLKDVGERNGVATRLIANAEDLETIAREDDADVPAMKGWRRAMFGEEALKLKRGEIALAARGKHLEIIDVLPDEDASD